MRRREELRARRSVQGCSGRAPELPSHLLGSPPRLPCSFPPSLLLPAADAFEERDDAILHLLSHAKEVCLAVCLVCWRRFWTGTVASGRRCWTQPYEHPAPPRSPAAASVRSAAPCSLGKLMEGQGQSGLRTTAVQGTTTPLQSRPIRPTTPTGFHFPRRGRYQLVRVRAPRGDTPSICGDPGGDEPFPGSRLARGSPAMMAGRAHGHRNRIRRLIPRVILLLFAAYAAFFAIYLLLHPHQPSPPDATPRTDVRGDGVRAPPSNQKPWPRLPSFLPWVGGPPPPPHTCEAYFGNGFSRRVEVLPARGGDGGWFRCHHSETLGSSICEGARVRLDPARIAMSRGGEPLEQVMGRAEEEELPKYEPGALQVEGPAAGRAAPLVDAGFLNTYAPTGGIGTHTMRALLESARVVPPGELHCSQWVEEPTLLVTRFEYANLFHTITDWYSAYVSSRITDLPKRPNVVFVDGHCKAQLEQTWEALFSSVAYAKNFSGPVCFRHAILSPLGYETAMFKGLSESFSCEGASAETLRGKPDYEKTARLSEFGEMIVASFDLLQDDIMSSKKSNGLNVLFVRREDYLAHPRHSGKVESRLSNEREVYDAIEKWAKGLKCKVNVVNGLFAHMTMKEQLGAILEASVVIGAHGAGLTHLVSATPDTKVLEIISSMYRRPHFALISQWKALEYHAINLPGSYARITDVISELSKILTTLGC